MIFFSEMRFSEKTEKRLEKCKKHAPDVGVEPTTVGLKVQRSTTELTGLL